MFGSNYGRCHCTLEIFWKIGLQNGNSKIQKTGRDRFMEKVLEVLNDVLVDSGFPIRTFGKK